MKMMGLIVWVNTYSGLSSGHCIACIASAADVADSAEVEADKMFDCTALHPDCATL